MGQKEAFGIKVPEESHALNRTRRNDLAKLKEDMEEHLKMLEEDRGSILKYLVR